MAQARSPSSHRDSESKDSPEFKSLAANQTQIQTDNDLLSIYENVSKDPGLSTISEDDRTEEWKLAQEEKQVAIQTALIHTKDKISEYIKKRHNDWNANRLKILKQIKDYTEALQNKTPVKLSVSFLCKVAEVGLINEFWNLQKFAKLSLESRSLLTIESSVWHLSWVKYTPLGFAVLRGRFREATFLIEQGASLTPKLSKGLKFHVKRGPTFDDLCEGLTLLHLFMSFEFFVTTGEPRLSENEIIAFLKFLIEKKQINPFQKDSEGNNAFHYCIVNINRLHHNPSLQLTDPNKTAITLMQILHEYGETYRKQFFYRKLIGLKPLLSVTGMSYQKPHYYSPRTYSPLMMFAAQQAPISLLDYCVRSLPSSLIETIDGHTAFSESLSPEWDVKFNPGNALYLLDRIKEAKMPLTKAIGKYGFFRACHVGHTKVLLQILPFLPAHEKQFGTDDYLGQTIKNGHYEASLALLHSSFQVRYYSFYSKYHMRQPLLYSVSSSTFFSKRQKDVLMAELSLRRDVIDESIRSLCVAFNPDKIILLKKAIDKYAFFLFLCKLTDSVKNSASYNNKKTVADPSDVAFEVFVKSNLFDRNLLKLVFAFVTDNIFKTDDNAASITTTCADPGARPGVT